MKEVTLRASIVFFQNIHLFLLKLFVLENIYKGNIFKYLVFICIVLALGGCAGFSEGGMDAEAARFRHSIRQGKQSGKGIKFYEICPEEFPQGESFVAIRDAQPASEGAQLIRDQVLTDVTIAKKVKEFGLPAAIGFESSKAGQLQHIAMFYKTPPHSLVLKRSSMSAQWLSLSQLYESKIVADLQAVPRSVQRLAFHEGVLPPPWPVIIAPDLRDVFAIPTVPGPPPSEVNGQDYIVVANDLMANLPISTSVQNQQRVEAALDRLEPAAGVKGIYWQVVLLNAVKPIGFGVPDGSLFVSYGLVQKLDDAELTAVIAHLMGHECYQHARAAANRANSFIFVSNVGAALAVAGGAMGFFTIPTGSYLGLITDPEFGYTQKEEVEANVAAARILKGANLPPDKLFDAMTKLLDKAEDGSLSFDSVHHLTDGTIIHYGLMLDAGLVGEQPNVTN